MTWRIALSALVMVFVGALLSEMGFRGKRVFGALCITLLLVSLLEGMGQIFSDIAGFAEGAGVADMAKCALKIVGASYVFGFVSEVAEELGEKGISSAVTTVGRVEIFALVFPYFKEIINAGIDLLK